MLNAEKFTTAPDPTPPPASEARPAARASPPAVIAAAKAKPSDDRLWPGTPFALRGFQSLGAFVPFVARPRRQATYAPWPVWGGSTQAEPEFRPLPKREAVKIWHKARAFERKTRLSGHQDGKIGRNGLAVLHALIFDFLNFATGELMPAQAKIASAANICVRSVARGLDKLKKAGVIDSLRRCADHFEGGRFVLRQLPNAYAIRSPSQWRGFEDRPPPTPYPEAWGAAPPLPDVLALAFQSPTPSTEAVLRDLESDQRDGLAAVLARLGRHVQAGGANAAKPHVLPVGQAGREP